jgi:hypothetical protein
MAFALALKSKFDFPNVGDMFFMLTLVITAFTSIYASLLLEPVLYKCGVIETEVKEYVEDIKNDKNSFEKFKDFLVDFSNMHLLPYVQRVQGKQNSDLKTALLMDTFVNKH